MGADIGVVQLLVVLAVIAVQIVPFWKIFPRAGWSPWMSLLMVVPLLNLVMLYVLAFKAWPMDHFKSEAFA